MWIGAGRRAWCRSGPGARCAFYFAALVGSFGRASLRRGGDIQKRLEQAEEDMAHWVEYDYVVINDQLSVALDDLVSIIGAERLKVERFHTYV